MKDHQIDYFSNGVTWAGLHCAYCLCNGCGCAGCLAAVAQTHLPDATFHTATVSTYMAKKLGIEL